MKFDFSSNAVIVALSEMPRKSLLFLEHAVRSALSRLDFKSNSKTHQHYIEAADELFVREGELEIDTCSAVVSESDDGGAYVSAWVWIGDDDVKRWRKKRREDRAAAKRNAAVPTKRGDR